MASDERCPVPSVEAPLRRRPGSGVTLAAIVVATLLGGALAGCGGGGGGDGDDGTAGSGLLDRNLQEVDVLPVAQANNTSTGEASVDLPESRERVADPAEDPILPFISEETNRHVVRYTETLGDPEEAGLFYTTIEFDDPVGVARAERDFSATATDDSRLFPVPGSETGSLICAPPVGPSAASDDPVQCGSIALEFADGRFIHLLGTTSAGGYDSSTVEAFQQVAANWYARVRDSE